MGRADEDKPSTLVSWVITIRQSVLCKGNCAADCNDAWHLSFEKSGFRRGVVEATWAITRRMLVAGYRRVETTHISLKMKQMCFTEMSVPDYRVTAKASE